MNSLLNSLTPYLLNSLTSSKARHLILSFFTLLSSLFTYAASAIVPISPSQGAGGSLGACRIYKYTPTDGGILYTMTRGNEWAIINQGRVDGDEEHVCPTQLFNMNTGELIPVMYQGHQIHVTMASNDGNILVGNYSDRAVSINRATGKMTVYPNRPLWHGGHLTDCTPDGRYAVGYYQGYLGKPTDSDLPNDWYYRTLLVDTQTGDTIATPGIPKTKRNGQRYESIKFTSISNDGRYITGAIDWYIEGSMTFIYDRLEDKVVSGTMLSLYHGDIAKKYDDVVSVSGGMASPSMTAFGCRVTKQRPDGSTFTCNGVYFADRDSLVTYDNMEDGGVSICAIDDNGTYYGITDGNMTPLRNFKVLYDGKYWVSLQHICQQRFGFDFCEVTGFERSGTIMGVSPDGHKVISFADPMGESFCIDFGMTANEACSTIDFLSNYTVSPESGSQFETLKSVEVTFDRPVRIAGSGKNIHLLDSNGNEIATGLSTSSALQFKSNSTTCVIATIRTRTLTPGEHYTLVIDAGTFATEKSDDCFSKEIRLDYVGRSGPVQMLKATPEAGSQLSRLDNSSSYAILSFDCKVKVTSNAHATLVHEDGSYAASLNMVAGYLDDTKHQVLIYPSSTFNLYKGQRYSIVIDPGSICDYNNGEKSLNERIQVDYQGNYVRPVPTGNVIFQDSWDDIAESLVTWLRYEGDHLTPRARPIEWEFDADNQPWNFSIRESNDNPDYCAGSHSMYAPSGQSDDWMMTPQLNIPNGQGKTILEFDAQSYYFDTEDILDVYVYEDSRVLAYLNDNNMPVIKQKAVRILSEKLSAGATMEGLANEWTHYTVDLSAWAGKDIYIAFVNQNRNQSAIFVDNVIVQREMLYTLALDFDDHVVAQTEQVISGRLTVLKDSVQNISLTLKAPSLPAQGMELTLQEIPEKTESRNYGTTDLRNSYLFTSPSPLPLTGVGSSIPYTIEIAIDSITDAYNGTITNLSFKPEKRVVLEEVTGITCPNCPLGIQAIQKLRTIHRDRFIPISIHTYTGDPYAYGLTDYSNFLQLISAPSARINRTKGIYYPMTSNGTDYFDSNPDNPLWADIVAQEMARLPLCNFSIKATTSVFSENSESRNSEYSATVRYAVNADNQQLALLFIVLEDSIENYQENCFGSVTSPLLGQWGKGGTLSSDYVYPYLHHDVARAIVGSNPGGTIGLFPTSFTADEDVTVTITQPFPTNVAVPANAHVVGMLIDTQTGEVINAAHCTFEDKASDGIISPYLSPSPLGGGRGGAMGWGYGVAYNLQGQRLTTPTPRHIYIKNGRKYLAQ